MANKLKLGDSKTLSKKKETKYDGILKKSKISKEIKNITKEEKQEIKAYSIKKTLKLKRYVRN